MSIKPLFADPNLLHLERVSSKPGLITIIVKTKSKQALCPECHSPSAHLHSRYVRRLADLPWFGVAVRVEVHARRLYCRHVECPQRISANASRPSSSQLHSFFLTILDI